MEMLTRVEDRKVAVQIIQTMSIICQNLNEESIRTLLEKGFLQKFVAYPFDFSDEETSEYYITWVKGLALRMSPTTVAYLVNREEASILERTVQFSSHADSMVSTAARTAILSLIRRTSYSDNNPLVPSILHSLHFTAQLASLISINIFQINTDLTNLQFRNVRTRLEDLEDTLLYCKDLMLVRESQIDRDMEVSLLYYVLLPVVVGVFAQDHMKAERISTQLAIAVMVMTLELFKGENVSEVVLKCVLEDELPVSILRVMREEPVFPMELEGTEVGLDLKLEGFLREMYEDCDMESNADNPVFGELTDLFRSKYPGLMMLLFRLSESMLQSAVPSHQLKLTSITHKLLNLLTTDDQSPLSVLVSLTHILSQSLSHLQTGKDRAIGELNSAVERLRKGLNPLISDSTPTSEAISIIAKTWEELKSLWTRYKPVNPIELLATDPAEMTEGDTGLRADLKRFMLLSNLKSKLVGGSSAFAFDMQAPVFLSYRSGYNWEEGKTYEVPMCSLYPCSLYFGPLSKNQVAYILDDDYFFIVLKPNTLKLGVGEVVYYQELTRTNFHLAREQSRRLEVQLLRDRRIDLTIRFDEHAKALDIYESLLQKQQSALEFEKSLINSLLYE